MHKLGLLAALVATLGVGWLLGSMLGGGGTGDATHDEVVSLREDVARLRLALGERGSEARTTGGLGGHGFDPEAIEPAAGSDVFDIARFDDPNKAFRALLTHAATMLDRGEEGHLTLLQTINDTFYAAPGEALSDKLMGGDGQDARYLYPVLRFAMHRDDQVAAMAETVFATMAEKPLRLKAFDARTLGLFTDRVAPMLPGLVGPARMRQFESWARAILAASQASQPRCVQRNRQDVQDALTSWSPPVAAEEAVLRLQRGELSAEEASALLRGLDPASIARLDVDTVLGPLVEHDPWRIIEVLARANLGAEMMARLDTRIIGAVAKGALKQAVVHFWLRYTDRVSFETARTFLERGLQQSSKATSGTFLLTALALKPPPDATWIAWAEKRYEFSEEVRVALMRMREKK